MPLRFPIEDIPAIAARYVVTDLEVRIQAAVRAVQGQRYLTGEVLAAVCQWKSLRQAARAEMNGAIYVQEISRFALAAEDERAWIEALRVLDGVEWATASAILHWFHLEPYPILDFRALWSLGRDEGPYDFAFWGAFLDEWRGELAAAQLHHGNAVVTPRIFDRALFQYSRENQVRGGV